jgi:hypothetical protein
MKKNRRFLWGASILALIFALALTACDHGGGSSFISGNIASLWVGNFGGTDSMLQISGTGTSGTWYMRTASSSSYEAGTYRMNGTTAVLYSASSSVIPIGQAGLVSSTTLVITLNAVSGSPGTYTATRPGSSGGSNITGYWTGTVNYSPVTLTIFSGFWSAVSSTGTGALPEWGVYPVSSTNTATLYNTSQGAGNIGSVTLTGVNALNLTLIGGYYPGTYPFIRSSLPATGGGGAMPVVSRY